MGGRARGRADPAWRDRIALRGARDEELPLLLLGLQGRRRGHAHADPHSPCRRDRLASRLRGVHRRRRLRRVGVRAPGERGIGRSHARSRAGRQRVGRKCGVGRPGAHRAPRGPRDPARCSAVAADPHRPGVRGERQCAACPSLARSATGGCVDRVAHCCGIPGRRGLRGPRCRCCADERGIRARRDLRVRLSARPVAAGEDPRGPRRRAGLVSLALDRRWYLRLPHRRRRGAGGPRPRCRRSTPFPTRGDALRRARGECARRRSAGRCTRMDSRRRRE
jgi:hypothetical protein